MGSTGLQVSLSGFGSWVTFGEQFGEAVAAECLQAAREAGVNFFDNAESYAGGESERIMGKAFASLGWPRHSYVVSDQGLLGPSRRSQHAQHPQPQVPPPSGRRLSRALRARVRGHLYCHRPDPTTPMEETVWAMSDMIAAGKALYWGTSEWTAADIREAWEIAERHHLRKPVVEQPQYNLLVRDRVERRYARLYNDCGIGLTTFSPLAAGLLTGKYLDGVPVGSRATLPGYDWLRSAVTEPARNAKAPRAADARRRARLHDGAARDRLVRP